MEKNRVEEQLAKWNKIEQRIRKNHTQNVSMNRAFRLEKLSALEKITVRIKKGETAAERVDLRIVREEKKKLEKELYPKRYSRFFRRIIVRFVMALSIKRELKVDKQNSAGKNNGLSEVNKLLEQAGLGELKKRVEEKIKLGLKNFSLPISRKLSERESVDYNIRVSSNKKGEYSLDGFRATLFHNNNDTGRSHHFKMQDGNMPDMEKAGHLLAGRAIIVETLNDGVVSRQWQQLNLNDRDVEGNYKIREHSGKQLYDLEKAITEVLSDRKITAVTMKGLISELEKGRLARYDHSIDGKKEEVLLSANPSKRIVETYTSEGKKIVLENKNKLNQSVDIGKQVGAKQQIKTAGSKIRINR